MEKIVFECESVTPMFMYGADGKTPELRPASVKGVMRFWWRAINGNLPLNELRDREGEIFGNTEKKSKVIIYPINITKTEDFKISTTPHHKKGYCSNNDNSKGCYFKGNSCMKANQRVGKLYTFVITIDIKSNKYMNREQLKNLFILTTTLGGLGQRSRRGFGCVHITKVDDINFTPPKTEQEIKEKIDDTFKYDSKINYPYIQSIQVGNKADDNYQELLETIGKTTHTYPDDMFGSGTPRYASPIYISVIKDGNKYRPIITTLHNTKSIDATKLRKFKEAIIL